MKRFQVRFTHKLESSTSTVNSDDSIFADDLSQNAGNNLNQKLTGYFQLKKRHIQLYDQKGSIKTILEIANCGTQIFQRRFPEGE